MTDRRTDERLSRDIGPTGPTDAAYRSSESSEGKGVASVVVIATTVSLAVNVLALSASHLWLYPDSRWYIALAVDVADRFDFGNELFLLRNPGYPLLLAGVFRVFGPWSPTAILVLQHAMAAGIAVLTTLTAWHVCLRRDVALIGGLLCACNLELLAFANVLMAEIPYTLALTASAYFLVKYLRLGRAPLLGWASALAGVSCLFRPVGFSLVGICLVAAWYETWRMRRDERLCEAAASRCAACSTHPLRRRGLRTSWWHLATGTALAMVPGITLVLPWAMYKSSAHPTADFTAGPLGLAMYCRAVAVEGLEPPNGEAIADIRAVVAEAKRLGHIGSNARYTDWVSVWTAYAAVRNASFAQASAVMGEVGKELFFEHAGLIARRTPTHMARNLLMPDDTYRFQPGGVMGDGNTLAKGADIFDTATYEPMARSDLEPLQHYLPLPSEPRAMTPVWTAIARWFYKHVDQGPPIIGLADTPYEEFVWLCIIGGMYSLLTRERIAWLVVGGVVFLQIFVNSLLAATQPRYAIPTQPLMYLYAALLLVAVIRTVGMAIRACYASLHLRYGRPEESHA